MLLVIVLGFPLFDFIQTQMQLDNVSNMRYRNSLHCCTSLIKDNGAHVLYTGFGVNTAREAIFLASYFYCYEGLRESFIRNSIPFNYAVPVAGGFSGAIGVCFMFALFFDSLE
jgi:hypothetical protein